MTSNRDLKVSLLQAAEALDRDQPEAALDALIGAPLVTVDSSVRPVALSLWKGVVRSSTASEFLKVTDPDAVCDALDFISQADQRQVSVWDAYRELPFLEKELKPQAAGAAVAMLFWNFTLKASDGIFIAVFELFFRSLNHKRFEAAWYQFLKQRKDYVPDYWRFHLYGKSLLDRGRSDLPNEIARCLETTDRIDLEPLVAIYLELIRQTELQTLSKRALALANPNHRATLGKYILSASYETEQMPIAADLFAELTKDAPLDAGAAAMMAARLSIAQQRWADVIAYTDLLNDKPNYRVASELLRGQALTHLGNTSEAFHLLTDVVRSSDADRYQRARATHTKVTADRLGRRVALPAPNSSPVFSEHPGRPLAQSLWVGPELRWIERLSIQSYLKNGWRFQLYVYEDLDNVPEGCEVLDANAIIPRKRVFREGAGSGLHAGSVGAFSDLFRYRLLHQRGGMWTDTDVINFRKFDPDGRRFISTEIVDAGLTGVNGAMMAAPAGDRFLARAYERACEIMESQEMFFTRIGPYLLAELLVEERADEFELMDTTFLNPVPWMRTARLLQPYESVAARPEIKNAINLHVYTETWRLIGLGLDKPPSPETFLGHLYDQFFGGQENNCVEENAA